MRRPLDRGVEIDMRRMGRWVADFSGYRFTVNEARIDRWLRQFKRRDRDLAARALDTVDFVTNEQVVAAYRSILGSLPGWHLAESRREGNWRFVAYSGSAGESGDAMLYRFRHANDLTRARYNDLFIHRSELVRADLGPDDTVVLVDDFSGSGEQVANAWPEFEELMPGAPRCFLALVAITGAALERVRQETGLEVVPHNVLDEDSNIFASSCSHFTSQEKEALLSYGRLADRDHPKGFQDGGLTVVFAHGCPNNTIPILHANSRRWEGLFRRHG